MTPNRTNQFLKSREGEQNYELINSSERISSKNSPGMPHVSKEKKNVNNTDPSFKGL